MSARKLLIAIPCLIASVPALGQLYLLLVALAGRYSHPYDLEWMEGGLLNHAARIADGSGIYVAPSLDFIPYLYPPLYPGLLAVFEPIVGLSYQSGRAISILAIVAIIAFGFAAVVPYAGRERRWLGWLGGALAAGFFAATYDWVDGWYDLVRADTLFVAMAIGGLLLCFRWSDRGSGWRGHARIAVAAAILGLSFFCKQTGVFFVAAGGAVVLVGNWRRVPVFVAVAGLIGLGGTALLTRASDGWFWTYLFEVHQTHHCHPGRFRDGFGQMLWHFPLMTGVVAVALVVVVVAWAVRRERPPASGPLLLWSWAFAVSVVVGAVGIATMWSHRNAYIPAMVTGAIAAGAALPALCGALSALGKSLRLPVAMPMIVSLLAGFALALQLVRAWWQPHDYLPRPADREAGDLLVERIRAIDGEVFIPFHPWYARLAGKRVYTHRMGIHDVRYRPPRKATEAECFFASSAGRSNWEVIGLPSAFERGHFAAIIWDNRSLPREPFLPGGIIARHYRLDDFVPKRMRPKVRSGAKVVPEQIWVPARPLPLPAGASALFDFEDGKLEGWLVGGKAWGKRPVTRAIGKQGAVRRFGGRYFADSMHGGDKAIGTLTSPAFDISGPRLTFRLSGGRESAKLRDQQRPARGGERRPWLRVELRIAGESVRHASVDGPASERMSEIEWRIPELVGKKAVLVLVDNAESSWGHINADEFWIWRE